MSSLAAAKQPTPRLHPDSNEPDEALVPRVAAGDAAAFGILIERHMSRVIGLSMRTLNNRAEAEEVAQEAFTRLWQRAGDWRPAEQGGGRFSTWFYRIAINLSLDRRRRPRTEALDDAIDPPDERPDAFTGIAARETEAAVRQAVTALPERQRLALELCFFQGLSNEAAGAILDIGIGAVESLLVRARRGLRETLAEFYHQQKEG